MRRSLERDCRLEAKAARSRGKSRARTHLGQPEQLARVANLTHQGGDNQGNSSCQIADIANKKTRMLNIGYTNVRVST